MCPTDNRFVPMPLQESILRQAYGHPQFAAKLFEAPTVCPRCRCEYVYITYEDHYGKIVLCQACGLSFTAKKVIPIAKIA